MIRILIMGKDLAKWLRDMLEQKGMTQAELAGASGLSDATISRVYTGQRGAGLDFYEGVARGFRMSLKEVLISAGILPDEDGYDPMSEEGRILLSEMDEGSRDEALAIIRILHEGKHERQTQRTAGRTGSA